MQKSAGTLTGKLDVTNSTLMQALTDTRKNLADYQNALKDFQATVKDSGSLIDDTLKTLDSVNAVASSGSAALADTSDLLATSRTAIGTFSTEFSTSLSDGETLLTNVYTSAALKLGTFETKATQVNTAIGDSISSASSLNKKMQKFWKSLPPFSSRSEVILPCPVSSAKKLQNSRHRMILFRNSLILLGTAIPA